MRRLLALLLLALTLTLALPAGAYAADWYVASTGSDTTGDGSAANPFASVQYAINAAAAAPAAPHTVHVGAGTYTGAIYMREGVSLSGAGAAITTLNAQGAFWCVMFENLGAGESISGFTITGAANGMQTGGITCRSSSPTISDNIITGNSAQVWGGGIACIDLSAPTITNNTISNNIVGAEGGGIYSAPGCSPIITRNVIAGNICSGPNGGGMRFESNAGPVITDNVIRDNSADFFGGGMIFTGGGSATITGNVITGNSVVANGGGIVCDWTTPLIANNVISNNSGTFNAAGIVLLNASTPFIYHNTIVGNVSAGTGGGVFCFQAGADITNNIVWGNSPVQVTGGLVTYSCVQGGTTADNNIVGDPLFRNAAGGDYRLSSTSPCINVGNPAVGTATDILGVARPQGTGFDMGAYELPVYVVTFDSQGGSAVAAQDVFETGPVTRPADPTRAGFTFGGWCTEAACTHVWDFAADTVTAPVTLYAKWTPIPITGMNAAYTMYAGDSLTIDAKPDGGTWGWDAAYFSATFNSPATFTALRTGSSVVTYTANGATASATITVLARPVAAVASARTLPATGADIAPTMLAALLTACAGVVLRVSSRKA